MRHSLDPTLREYVFEQESLPPTLSRALGTETRKKKLTSIEKDYGSSQREAHQLTGKIAITITLASERTR